MTIRVAHVITDLQTGGEARILSWLLPALRQEGIESIVAVLAPNVHDRTQASTPIMRELTGGSIPVEDLEVRRAVAPRGAARLARLLRSTRPDVVHTYLFHAGLVARPLARTVTSAAVVSSLVNVDHWKGFVTAKLEALSLRLAHRILANGYSVRDRVVADSPALASRILVYHNGIDAGRVRSAPTRKDVVPDDGPALVMITRLRYGKGPDIGIEVFRRVTEELPAARLFVVGEGTMLDELRRMATARGISDRVRFLGILGYDDTLGVLKAADVLLVPSRWEGLPAVILEAFAAGVPVVATDVGSIAEAVEDGVAGALAPAGDVDALARLSVRMLTEPAYRDTVVEGARSKIDYFSAERMIEDRVRFYRTLG